MRKRTMVTVFGLMLVASAAALAHVRIQPAESKPGATETYSMRVPTEGKVATTSVELEVPDGVTIVSISGPASEYETKKAGNRITNVTWKVNIAPSQAQQLTFVAKNPPTGAQIAWKVHQRYSDGTSSDWVDGAGTPRPSPVTKLASAP